MNLQVDVERVQLAHKAVRAELLAERSHQGQWVGHLASSPLATAAAISALVAAHRRDTEDTLRDSLAGNGPVIEQLVQCDLSELLLESVHWLARHQNPDGGWGDCNTARSNLAATMLVQAAFRMTGVPAKYVDLVDRADEYIDAQGGAPALRRSGGDKAVVAAILAHCALAGIIPWRQVPTLPFEILSLPKRWQRHIEMPYSRFATPLLVAVGRLKYHYNPPRNPLTRLLRRSVRASSLKRLESLHATDDSFLASTLVTAFVVTSLASIGCQDHAIVQRGLEFLLSSVRGDASWSIGTNCAVIITALAFDSLEDRSAADRPIAVVSRREGVWSDLTASTHTSSDDVTVEQPLSKAPHTGDATGFPFADSVKWLLDNQRLAPDPSTEAPAGGWASSEAPGAMPNSVATAEVLVTLARSRSRDGATLRDRIDRAACRGLEWLLELQAENGGWRTFYSHGNGFLPDDAGADVTGHALRALAAWQQPSTPWERSDILTQIGPAIERGWRYLQSQQRDDGRFVPVWFGNEHQPDDANPVYGTAQVLITCAELDRLTSETARRAARWLVSAQHSTGGWGPPRAPRDYSAAEKDGFRAWRANEAMAKLASVEETAMAITALLPLVQSSHGARRAVSAGLMWLAGAVEQDAHRCPAVIGFYPSKLWYHERLYPLVFAAGALSRAIARLAAQPHETASMAAP